MSGGSEVESVVAISPAVDEIDISRLRDIAFNDPVTFLSLLSGVSQAQVDQLILEPSERGEALLYVQVKHTNFLLALLKVASTQAIDRLILQQDQQDCSILSWPEIKNSPEVFKLLIQRASSAVLNESALKSNKQLRTVFHVAASDQDSESYQALVSKVSPEVCESVFQMQDLSGETPLHVLAVRSKQLEQAEVIRNADSIRMVLAKLSLAVKNAIFLLKNKRDEMVLHALCNIQDHSCVAQCLEEASVETLNTAVVWSCTESKSLLLTLAFKKNTANYVTLINKVDVAALGSAAAQQDPYGQTILCVAAYKQKESFQLLIEKLSAGTAPYIDAALMKSHREGGSALHIIAGYQTPGCFRQVIKAGSALVLNKMLPEQNKEGDTVLGIALKIQTVESCQLLIDTMDVRALSTSITKKNKKGYTGLWLADKTLPLESLQGLVDKVEAKALVNAVLYQSFSQAEARLRFALFAMLIHKNPRYISGCLATIKDYRLFEGPDKQDIINVLKSMTKPAAMAVASPDTFLRAMDLMISSNPLRISHHQEWLEIMKPALSALRKQKKFPDAVRDLRAIRERVRLSENPSQVSVDYHDKLNQSNQSTLDKCSVSILQGMAAFDAYLHRRQRETRSGYFAFNSLFGYSKADYVLRLGVYAELQQVMSRSRHDQKAVLEKALLNSKITGGWRHQCADILRSMLKDVNQIIRLERETPKRCLTPVLA